MKIALCLFGHIRTFESCCKLLMDNVISPNHCDVFIHTWDTMDSATLKWDVKRQNVQGSVNKELLEKIYKPTKIEIDHQEVKEDLYIKSTVDNKINSLTGMNFMFYSMERSNFLRKKYECERNFKYDYIIVTRPDVAVKSKFEIGPYIAEAETLNLDLDNVRFFAGLYGSSTTNVRLLISRVSDLFFFAKPIVIDRFIEANKNLKKRDAESKFYNISTIYTSNEIKKGIFPVEICFEFGSDYENIKNYKKCREKSALYKLLHFYWLRGKK